MYLEEGHLISGGLCSGCGVLYTHVIYGLEDDFHHYHTILHESIPVISGDDRCHIIKILNRTLNSYELLLPLDMS